MKKKYLTPKGEVIELTESEYMSRVKNAELLYLGKSETTKVYDINNNEIKTKKTKKDKVKKQEQIKEDD